MFFWLVKKQVEKLVEASFEQLRELTIDDMNDAMDSIINGVNSQEEWATERFKDLEEKIHQLLLRIDALEAKNQKSKKAPTKTSTNKKVK